MWPSLAGAGRLERETREEREGGQWESVRRPTYWSSARGISCWCSARAGETHVLEQRNTWLSADERRCVVHTYMHHGWQGEAILRTCPHQSSAPQGWHSCAPSGRPNSCSRRACPKGLQSRGRCKGTEATRRRGGSEGGAYCPGRDIRTDTLVVRRRRQKLDSQDSVSGVLQFFQRGRTAGLIADR